MDNHQPLCYYTLQQLRHNIVWSTTRNIELPTEDSSLKFSLFCVISFRIKQAHTHTFFSSNFLIQFHWSETCNTIYKFKHKREHLSGVYIINNFTNHSSIVWNKENKL